MRTFVRHYILPLARKRRWRSICEIGARTGTSTNYLLSLPIEYSTIIDPCIDEDLAAKYAGESRVHVFKSNSLDALVTDGPVLPGSPFDAILIDGDHNWYTVFNELRLILRTRPGAAGRIHFSPRCGLALWPPRLVLPTGHHSGGVSASIRAKRHDSWSEQAGRRRRIEQQILERAGRRRTEERCSHGS